MNEVFEKKNEKKYHTEAKKDCRYPMEKDF